MHKQHRKIVLRQQRLTADYYFLNIFFKQFYCEIFAVYIFCIAYFCVPFKMTVYYCMPSVWNWNKLKQALFSLNYINIFCVWFLDIIDI